MKILYFDINGTIVRDYQCKPALAGGAFEQAVREAGFRSLVCMSNAQSFIKLLDEMGHAAPNPLAIMFDMCWGAFRDADWFYQVTTLVPDPEHRALFDSRGRQTLAAFPRVGDKNFSGNGSLTRGRTSCRE